MKQTSEILTDVFERITDAFVALDTNWCYTYMNKKAGEIFQRNPADMIGKHIWTEFPEGIDQSYKAYHNAMEQQQYIHLEEYYSPYNRWFENHIYPSPNGISIFFRDITEKKVMEEKLALSEKRFRAMVENNEDIISLVDEKSNVLFHSVSAARITGWTNEELARKSLLEYIHPEDIQSFQLLMTKALQNHGVNFPLAIRVKHKNGHYILLEGIIKNMLQDPAIKGVIANMKDITERKLAEEKILFEHLEKMALINSTDDFMWSVSQDLKLIAANTPFINNIKTVTGVDLKAGDEILLKVFPEEFLNQWQSYYKRALLGESFREETYSNYSTDKSYTWIETAFNPIYLNQDIIGIACYSRNITERKKAEEQIKESEEKFRTLVQQAADGIVIVDEAGNYLEANESMAKLTGYSVNELKTMNGSEIVEAEDLRKNPLKIEEIKTGNPVFIERVIVKKDGTLRNIEISAKLMQNNKVICILRDTTERKKIEKKIRLSEIRLLKAQQIGKFGYWQQDLNSNMVWASNEAMHIYGFKAEEGELESVKIAACIIDVEKVKEAAINLVEHGKEYNIEIRINPADGLPMKYISAIAELEKNEKGEPIRIVGTLQDITDRKLAEENFKSSEIRYRRLFQAAKDGILILNFDTGIIEDVNPYLCEMLHYTREAFLGKELWEIGLYKDMAANKDAFLKLKKTKYERYDNLPLLTKEGQPIWVEFVSNVYEESDRMVIQCNIRNITDRKKAADELRQSESRTRRIFESDMIGFIYWDVNGEILDANDRFLKMTGYSKQDLHENKINWSKMTPPEYLELDRLAIEHVVNTGICQPYEKEYFRKDGSRLAILIGATALEGSNFGKGVSYVMDITERVKAEKNLRENENYLRTILDTEPECVKILNRKGELVSMNPAGLAMIEAENEQEVLGHQMTEMVVKKYRKGFHNLSKAVFKGSQGSFEFEITGLKGGHRWLETHAVPLKDALGRITGLLGVTRDITERKQAQTELENTTDQLRQLTVHLQTIREEERKRIAREIHDELGQQLTAIKMDLAWLDKKIPVDIKVAEAIIPVKSKLKNLISLVDGSNESIRKILNELRHGILEDNGLLEALEWQGSQFTEVAGIPVKFITREVSLVLPEGIANCLFRLYKESLTNIARYAEASKVITSIKIKKENIILTVEDDGKGFDVNAVQNKKSFGILGMKERVFSLHGKFDLVSAKGKGTKIEISLPLNESVNLK